MYLVNLIINSAHVVVNLSNKYYNLVHTSNSMTIFKTEKTNKLHNYIFKHEFVQIYIYIL